MERKGTEENGDLWKVESVEVFHIYFRLVMKF